MFTKMATLVALSLLASQGFAQQKFVIKVLNEDKKAIVGATVTMNGISKQTNHLGFTEFDLKESTINNLKVNFLGYQNYQTTLSDRKQDFQIILIPNSIQVSEVHVNATRARENAATTYKNINKEDIKKLNLGQDIPYLLNQTPGVIIGSDAGNGIGYTSMRIRGSDNQRINVTLNGIPLNDAESMGSFFVNLPDFASSTESIQVQRGIGTSTNGAGAFGASLNIQTDALEQNPYAEINSSYGSFNSLKNTIKAGTGLINNRFAFNTRLSRIISDGYMERGNSNLKSFYADAGLYTDKHTLKATLFSGKEKTYQVWNGVPEPLIKGDPNQLTDYAYNALGIYDGPEFDRLMQANRRYNQFTYEDQTDNYTQTHAHLHYTSIWSDKVSFNAAAHYTRGAGYYEEYRDNNKFSDYGLPNVFIKDDTGATVSEIKRTDLIRRRWLDNHFYGMTYSLNYKPNNTWNFIFGGAANQYIGDHYGEVIWARYASTSEINDKYYLNDAQKNDINFYAKADFKKNNWLINIDVQGRRVDYQVEGNDNKVKNMNFNDDLFFFNPKLGATYLLNEKANVYASYAYAGKEPVRKDYVENPKGEFPKPEFMQNLEAGYRFYSSTFQLGTNLYAMLYKDQLIPTGTLNDTGATLRINVPKSYRIGLEFDASWLISDKFIWSGTAALSENKIKDFTEAYSLYDNEDNWNLLGEETINHGNKNIAMSPSAVLSNNFTYKPLKNLGFSLMSKYVSRMYLDNTSAEERSINPYFIHNLITTYSFAALGIKNIDLNLAVNNLFGKEYETGGYTWRQKFQSKGTIDHYNFYFPQAKTNFMFGLNLRF